MSVFAIFKEVLAQHGIKRNHRITVALSGGPDSTALASLVARWWADCEEGDAGEERAGALANLEDRESVHGGLSVRVFNLLHGIELAGSLYTCAPCSTRPVAAVVDHDLRPESQKEAAQVLELAKNLGLEICHKKVCWGATKPEKAKAMKEARRERYMALYMSSLNAGSQVLMTGHNQGDQAETFLARFFRASGISGLAGMQVATLIQPGCPGPLFGMDLGDKDWPPVLLLRPLLGVPKSSLLQYCEDNNLAYILDPTNEDLFYARIRMRKLLQGKTELADAIARIQAACLAARRHQETEAFHLLQQAWMREEGTLEDGDRVGLELQNLKVGNVQVLTILMLVLLQIVAKKQHPPRSAGVEGLVNALLSGRLSRQFSLCGCLVKAIPGTQGRRIWISKAPEWHPQSQSINYNVLPK